MKYWSTCSNYASCRDKILVVEKDLSLDCVVTFVFQNTFSCVRYLLFYHQICNSDFKQRFQRCSKCPAIWKSSKSLLGIFQEKNYGSQLFHWPKEHEQVEFKICYILWIFIKLNIGVSFKNTGMEYYWEVCSHTCKRIIQTKRNEKIFFFYDSFISNQNHSDSIS
jgi:hypothetical protein